MQIKVSMVKSGVLNFVVIPNLGFGVYDPVAHFVTGMKACVWIYEKLNFTPGVYMLKSYKTRNFF